MAGNASKRILHVSNYSLCLSLGALIILSFIDVVPWKQAILTSLFYSCGIVFAISLSITVCTITARSFHRKRDNANEAKSNDGESASERKEMTDHRNPL